MGNQEIIKEVQMKMKETIVSICGYYGKIVGGGIIFSSVRIETNEGTEMIIGEDQAKKLHIGDTIEIEVNFK